MSWAKTRVVSVLSCVALLAVVVPATAQEETQYLPLPEWDEVERIVRLELYDACGKDYEEGDIVAREEISVVWKKLFQAGWDVGPQKELSAKFLSKGDWLPRALRTRQGTKFMRQIAKKKNAYSCLDRLSKLPQGKESVNQLIRNQGGAKMIEYLTSGEGNRQAAQMLKLAPKGKDFDKPTGRIYDVEGFLEALWPVYYEVSQEEDN